MPNTYFTTLQFEFVLRACASYVDELETLSKDQSLKLSRREQFESHHSKEAHLWGMLEPIIVSALKASKRMEAKPTPIDQGVSKIYSPKVQSEIERTMEILKRPPVGIVCINTFREGEVCDHDRAHHFKVHGKKNPICRQIGCACDGFKVAPKEKAFSNNLGLSFDDFKIE